MGRVIREWEIEREREKKVQVDRPGGARENGRAKERKTGPAEHMRLYMNIYIYKID